MVTMVVIVRRFVWRRSIFHHPTSSVFDFFSYFCIIFLDVLKSATKPLKVLIAFTRPLITEFADNLNLKHPLLPTISPYPTM